MNVPLIALVSASTRVALDFVTLLAAALQKQVLRDFQPVWNRSAVVTAAPDVRHVPVGYAPIIIVDSVGGGIGGVHRTQNGAPYGLVQVGPSLPLVASHECLEMILDPTCGQLVPGNAPLGVNQRVEFLLEICDPCEAPQWGYSVDGFMLSDFVTPAYYAPPAPGSKYSFRGNVKRPLQVLRGGYLSWVDAGGTWWQARNDTGRETLTRIGTLDLSKICARSAIDQLAVPQHRLRPLPRKGTPWRLLGKTQQSAMTQRSDGFCSAVDKLIADAAAADSTRKRRAKTN